jgi:uncharacterized protein YndB with AHSA1/START domain
MTATMEIRKTTIETPTEREIVIRRAFDAPRALVFEALTSPEHLPNWMLGPDGWVMTDCEIDLTPGGAWRYAWRRVDGDTMELSGHYREVEPPTRIVLTESWGGDWPETLNTLLLDEDEGRTTMTQTMAFPSREARDAALKSGMQEGVSRSFERLADHLGTVAR